MVTLALRLQDDFPRHYPLFATRTFTYNGETYRNHNTMLFSYEGSDGLKTGYTRASGFNLVASVRRGRKHVVGAVFGGATASQRNAAMRTYLNIGLMKASNEKTRRPAPCLIARAKPQPADALPHRRRSLRVRPAARRSAAACRRDRPRAPGAGAWGAASAATPRRAAGRRQHRGAAGAGRTRAGPAATIDDGLRPCPAGCRRRRLPHPDRRIPEPDRGRAPAGFDPPARGHAARATGRR